MTHVIPCPQSYYAIFFILRPYISSLYPNIPLSTLFSNTLILTCIETAKELAFSYRIGDIIMQRSLKPWLFPSALFAVTSLKKLQTKCLAILHGATKSVIMTRKQEFLAEMGTQMTEQSDENDTGKGYSSTAATFSD
jgi:hypothetical protein